jgi:Zn-dependent M28 family amino/carboxypeptidase
MLKAASGGEIGESFDLNPSKQLKFTVAVKEEKGTTQNVVGILEGADPKLKEEYVALGAHYDHVGIGNQTSGGDVIYNGADDDGSGTVSILAIAEAFAKGPRPKRSLLFVWHCGEEKGLWGSRYITDFPLIPLGSDRGAAEHRHDWP